MLPVFTAEEMRGLDRRAIETLGLSVATLMENAGRGAADAIVSFLPTLGLAPAARVAVVCGKGGNAGDGFVVARLLAGRGAHVSVWLATPPGEIGGEAATKLEELDKNGIHPLLAEDAAAVSADLAQADLVVDALLGTGTRGPAEARVARLIDIINTSGRPVAALDVPSGLLADGGPPPGPVVRAALTVTFAGLKRALVTPPGMDFAGYVRVVDIGIPPSEVRRGAGTFLLEASDVARHLPSRRRATHKGTYGHLLIVAGSRGKTGAAALAARAAMRSGAGLVTVGTAVSQQPILATLVVEAMTEPLPETAAGSPSLKAAEIIVELASSREAVAIGPGLGRDPDTLALARELARGLPKPLVIDADALTALAGHLHRLRSAPAARCLTPHPGEMGRLLGIGVAEVERNRIELTRELARTHGVHVVLKGAASVIAAPSGEVYINPTGNPGMASGGTGDVLTGMVGAFLARGLEAGAALQAAVYLHGRAGDLAATRVGQEALIASDVIAALPDAFRELQAAHAG